MGGRRRVGKRRRFGIAALALAVQAAGAPALTAQTLLPGRDLPGNGFGFHAAMGWSSIGGDYGELLTSGIPAEGGFWYQTHHLRAGANIQVGSYDVVEPFSSQSVSHVELAASATWRVITRSRLQPFVSARGGMVRFKPEGALFDPNPPPPDQPPGESPGEQRTGFIYGVAGGLEYWLNQHIAISATGQFQSFSTEDLELPFFAGQEFSSGSMAGFRLGVEWKP